MPIPSARTATLPRLSRPETPAPYLWIDVSFMDASLRTDVVPMTLRLVNFAQPDPGDERDFATDSKREIKLPDLFALAARNPIIAAGINAYYLAVMEIDRMQVTREALEAQLPAAVDAAATAWQTAADSRQTAKQARYTAGTVARLDAELIQLNAELARLAALPVDEVDPMADQYVKWHAQRVAEIPAEREAAVLTALDDEAVAVKAEAIAGDALAAAEAGDAALVELRGQVEALRF